MSWKQTMRSHRRRHEYPESLHYSRGSRICFAWCVDQETAPVVADMDAAANGVLPLIRG